MLEAKVNGAQTELMLKTLSLEQKMRQLSSRVTASRMQRSKLAATLDGSHGHVLKETQALSKTLGPTAGTTRELAITITWPVQAAILMRSIQCIPYSFKRLMSNNFLYYDHFKVARRLANGDFAETEMWFDIHDNYHKFVKITNHRATEAPSTFDTWCASCGQQAAKSKCAICKQAVYCDIVCQKNHWKNGHAPVCKLARAALCAPPAVKDFELGERKVYAQHHGHHTLYKTQKKPVDDVVVHDERSYPLGNSDGPDHPSCEPPPVVPTPESKAIRVAFDAATAASGSNLSRTACTCASPRAPPAVVPGPGVNSISYAVQETLAWGVVRALIDSAPPFVAEPTD